MSPVRRLPEGVSDPPDHDPPYPPLELAYRVGSLRDTADLWRTYEEMGAESKRRILEVLPADWSFEGKRILDFGCGAGRSLRHFTGEAEVAKVCGCDIDEPSIQWIQEHLSPPLVAFVNQEVPPIGRPSGSFDLIYALSVFTHLTERWGDWLLELHRLLDDGGILIATFLGTERAARVLPPEVAGEQVRPETTGMNQLAHGRSWDHGGPLVVHSEWWIREHWGRAFEILELVGKGFWSNWDQGYVVMRKRPVELTVEALERPNRDDPRELDAARENVGQLARQLAPFWDTVAELRERQAELRGRVVRLRKALDRQRSGDGPQESASDTDTD